MNFLDNNKELLKYIEIWNKMKVLFNEKFNKRALCNKPVYNNESNKVSYGKHGANKYYIGYLSGSFRPLCIIITEIKLYTDHLNILANSKEFLKYIEIME